MLKIRSLLSEVHALLYNIRKDQNNLFEVSTLHHYFNIGLECQTYACISFFLDTFVHLHFAAFDSSNKVKYCSLLTRAKYKLSLYSDFLFPTLDNRILLAREIYA